MNYEVVYRITATGHLVSVEAKSNSNSLAILVWIGKKKKNQQKSACNKLAI
jgi:hypothetical protein